VTVPRTVVVSLVAMCIGVAVGRTLPRETKAVARSASSSAPVPAAPDRACKATRAELATVKAQLGVCMAYAQPRADPAPAPEPPHEPPPPALAEPQGMDAIRAEIQKIGAEREKWESSREVVVVENRDGRWKYYRPEDWPPDGGDMGARVVMRKLPDGTWEEYDPSPRTVRMAGPPGPDGLVTLPGGKRVRWVFTDAGAPIPTSPSAAGP
jgi:hypothetical protein